MGKEYCNAIEDICAFPSMECKQCLHGKSEAKEETEMDKITTEIAEHICDKLCQYPHIYTDQEELDNICCECKVGKFLCDILNTYNKINDLQNSECAKMLEKMQTIDKLYLEKCVEVNQLKEKQTPKKVIQIGAGQGFECPSCKTFRSWKDGVYCKSCGQLLNWDEYEQMKGEDVWEEN